MDNKRSIASLGFYSAILTTVITIITFTIAYLTPPLSGPLCAGVCFNYPYLDIASRYPRDYIWMFPAMLLLIAYAVLMSCIHYYFSTERKIYSHIGLFFAFGSALILIVDYFLQLSVIQPSLLKGEAEGVSLLTQFNPHGIFIALEEVGYILMSFSFLFMAPVFFGSKLHQAVRWTFILAFALTMLSYIFFSIKLDVNREYVFEITAISISWLALIVSGILLSILFKRTTGTAFPGQVPKQV